MVCLNFILCNYLLPLFNMVTLLNNTASRWANVSPLCVADFCKPPIFHIFFPTMFAHSAWQLTGNTITFSAEWTYPVQAITREWGGPGSAFVSKVNVLTSKVHPALERFLLSMEWTASNKWALVKSIQYMCIGSCGIFSYNTSPFTG